MNYLDKVEKEYFERLNGGKPFKWADIKSKIREAVMEFKNKLDLIEDKVTDDVTYLETTNYLLKQALAEFGITEE